MAIENYLVNEGPHGSEVWVFSEPPVSLDRTPDVRYVRTDDGWVDATGEPVSQEIADELAVILTPVQTEEQPDSA